MIDTSKYPIQIRVNARLVNAGRKNIEQFPEDERVLIYVILNADYNLPLEEIPVEYLERVKQEIESITM